MKTLEALPLESFLHVAQDPDVHGDLELIARRTVIVCPDCGSKMMIHLMRQTEADTVEIVLTCIAHRNPLSLYLSNYQSGDGNTFAVFEAATTRVSTEIPDAPR
jgi:DNA-directed RNA polymerase subunit RPC12/RpoP